MTKPENLYDLIEEVRTEILHIAYAVRGSAQTLESLYGDSAEGEDDVEKGLYCTLSLCAAHLIEQFDRLDRLPTSAPKGEGGGA